MVQTWQVLLSRLDRYLWTADSQFNFKAAHGTDVAIFAHTQKVDLYSGYTHQYACALLILKKHFIES